MDGIHDLGGKDGFGRVVDDREPVGFVQRWHGAVFTMVNSLYFAGVTKNTDQFRHSVERIDPISYLTDGYYGRWLGGIETMLVEAGVVTQEEISAKAVALGGSKDARIAARPKLSPDVVPDAQPDNVGAKRASVQVPGFAVGNRVRPRSTPSSGHTRLPAYVRGVVGCVVEQHGTWVLPDASAHGLEQHDGQQGEHLYTVQFRGVDVFGEGSGSGMDSKKEGHDIYVDLFESYLESITNE
jgi:nitrile hydratase beta subunit